MTSKIVICLLLTFFLLTVSLAQAQQPRKIPRIGFLVARSPSANVDRIEAFRQGLRELGYVEGKKGDQVGERREAIGNSRRKGRRKGGGNFSSLANPILPIINNPVA